MSSHRSSVSSYKTRKYLIQVNSPPGGVLSIKRAFNIITYYNVILFSVPLTSENIKWL